jgi:hypothetical protein
MFHFAPDLFVVPWNCMPAKRTHIHPADLRAGGRLAIEAVIGVTNLVEAMHATIAGVTLP